MEISTYDEQKQNYKTQLNIRVQQNTADAFRQYCKEMHLTQDEGLASLLLYPQHTGRDLAEFALQQQCAHYKAELSDTQSKCDLLRNAQTQKELTDWQKSRDWAIVVREMLSHITKPDYEHHSQLQVGRFKWAPEKAHFRQHQYPQGAGCMMVHLEALIYSKNRHPALFILARSAEEESDHPVKFRWYPNDRFFGVVPRHSTYAKPDSLWLMGYMPASDGASTLIAALPIEALNSPADLYQKFYELPPFPIQAAENAPHPSLDSQIAEIEQRKNKK